ncbi:RDD family protein (plasmid) [Coraliomargarita sp. W4R53]
MSTSAEPFPGERMGLPKDGQGSIAKLGRRVGALFVDYIAATIIATFIGYNQFALPAEAGFTTFYPLIVFAAIQIIFLPVMQASPGHRIFGLTLRRVDGAWVGLWRPIVRTVLLLLVIPAAIWDADHRGLHDKVAATVLVRA